jgi:hypothetical protein
MLNLLARPPRTKSGAGAVASAHGGFDARPSRRDFVVSSALAAAFGLEARLAVRPPLRRRRLIRRQGSTAQWLGGSDGALRRHLGKAA